jgi:hypothetical protein
MPIPSHCRYMNTKLFQKEIWNICNISSFVGQEIRNDLRSNIKAKSRGNVQVCEMLRISHCLDNRFTDGDEVISITRLPRFGSQRYFLVVISVRGWVNPRTYCGWRGLGKLNKCNYLIDNRTRDLKASSIVPQSKVVIWLTN